MRQFLTKCLLSHTAPINASFRCEMLTELWLHSSRDRRAALGFGLRWLDVETGGQAVACVLAELDRQITLCRAGRFSYCIGDGRLSHAENVAILLEELGELAHEMTEGIGVGRAVVLPRIVAELTQVCACLARWMYATHQMGPHWWTLTESCLSGPHTHDNARQWLREVSGKAAVYYWWSAHSTPIPQVALVERIP